MALLYCFPEIHLRQSMHYCPNGAFPSAGSGWNQPILTKRGKYRLDFTPFIIDYSIASHLAV